MKGLNICMNETSFTSVRIHLYTMAQIYRYIDVMITHYKMAGDHNVHVSIDLGHTV